MTAPPCQTTAIQACLDRLRGGDEAASGELLSRACGRLRALARKMLKGFPKVRRWEESDDVLQNALVRLYRALKDVPPQGVPDFLRLAALNIRRELLDLARHYYGPHGRGARHATWGPAPADLAPEPSRLAAWSEFHERIGALPGEEREVFDLLWYQGLSQAEAAGLLNTSERTVKRRWQSARLRLHEAMRGEVPE